MIPTYVRRAANSAIMTSENASAGGVALTTHRQADDLSGGVDVAKDMPACRLVGEAS